MIRWFVAFALMVGLMLAAGQPGALTADPPALAAPPAPTAQPATPPTEGPAAVPPKVPEPPRKERPKSKAVEMADGTWVASYECKHVNPVELIGKLQQPNFITYWNADGKAFITSYTDGNKRSTLVFSGPLKNIQEAEKLLLDVFDVPVMQVVIDVRIVEITYSSSLQVGFEVLYDYLNDTSMALFKGAHTSFFPIKFTGSFPSLSTSSPGFGTFFFNRTRPTYKLDAAIAALKKDSKVEILSKPSITVASGQPAFFRAVENLPITKSTATATGVISTDTTWQDIGITLSVTPVLVGDDSVYLTISPKVQEITGTQTTTAGGVTVENPTFVTREINTQMTVKDRQTVVMGGLIYKKTTEEESKVPIVGDIPIIGVLFTGTSKVKKKTEVIFFITTEIVNPRMGGSVPPNVPLPGDLPVLPALPELGGPAAPPAAPGE